MAITTEFSTVVYGDSREEIEARAKFAVINYLGREPFSMEIRVETTENEYGPPGKYKAFVYAT